MPVFTDLAISLDVEHILQGQGLDPSRRLYPKIVQAAHAARDELQVLLSPVALYEIVPVYELAHHAVVLASGVAFEGALVARALAGADEAVLSVCTIGPALEARVSELFAAGDSLLAMALDGAGIAALHAVSGLVGERVCDEASARMLRVGMRASPGQEGWPIEQQKILFDQIRAERIGVRLTDGCMMRPQKSVSFVLGLGPEMQADAEPCDFCSKRERCRWRSRQSSPAMTLS